MLTGMERTASAVWSGGLKDGKGKVSTGSGGLKDASYSFTTRFENGGGTDPEELIAAAHSACFSMALSNGLATAGTAPTSLDTSADVEFTPGKGITGIKLTVRGVVEGMSNEDFVTAAEGAKANCPVSQALTGTTITLDAALS